MRVLGYTWAGVRTADLKSATRFFADVLGFSLIHEGAGLVQFEVPSGQPVRGLRFGESLLSASRLPSSGLSGGGCARGQEGVGVTGCRVRHRCRWQPIRGLGLFSRPRRLPIRALADGTPLESAATQLAAEPAGRQVNAHLTLRNMKSNISGLTAHLMRRRHTQVR